MSLKVRVVLDELTTHYILFQLIAVHETLFYHVNACSLLLVNGLMLNCSLSNTH